MKMLSSDHGELLKAVESPKDAKVHVSIDGVEMIPAKSFCSRIRSSERRVATQPVFNYHRLVFRAEGETAKLTISDWANDDTPGGPIGQEIMVNFVEIQPYLED